MFCKNDFSGQQLSPVKSLGLISSLLIDAGLSGENLNEALEIIGSTVAAEAVGIFRKWFDAANTIRIDFLGSWPAKSANHSFRPESLRFEAIPASIWQKLEAHKRVYFDVNNPHLCSNDSGLCLLPIFLKENLFGFIIVCGIMEGQITSNQENFLLAVCNVFELWISNLNMAKRLDDLIEFLPDRKSVV